MPDALQDGCNAQCCSATAIKSSSIQSLFCSSTSLCLACPMYLAQHTATGTGSGTGTWPRDTSFLPSHPAIQAAERFLQIIHATIIDWEDTHLLPALCILCVLCLPCLLYARVGHLCQPCRREAEAGATNEPMCVEKESHQRIKRSPALPNR